LIKKEVEKGTKEWQNIFESRTENVVLL
jgi:hypothetical protein